MGLLRNAFGPSRHEVWQRLSDEIGATYLPAQGWKGDRIDAHHGQWVVTLDSYHVMVGRVPMPCTRMRAPYVNPDRFRFCVYRRSWAADVAKWFGSQDVEIGDAQFDREFIVKGTDEGKLRALFADEHLRQLLMDQPEIRLEVRDHEGFFGPTFPPDTDELVFELGGEIRDVERLKGLFEIFAETLSQLCRIGSAYEQDPGIRL